MKDRIYACNRIMRPLKAYIERGESNENVLNLVGVLNQLNDNELAFVMAKYVTLATFRDDGKIINQASSAKLKEHLNLKGKAFGKLEHSVYEKVHELYFEEIIDRYRQEDDEFARKQAEREDEKERWNQLKNDVLGVN
ncbi:hypothetical protein [Ruoffia sp. FAM 26255]|uniref:hypothetical protein n=1 Tax=Ruoffia sp. FAM 26255 TaxID=3259519 RepID=UPI003887F759